MSAFDKIPEGTICVNDCNHLATQKWIGQSSTFELVHGGSYSPWCECCVLDAQLEYAREQAERIPLLEQELKDALETCK